MNSLEKDIPHNFYFKSLYFGLIRREFETFGELETDGYFLRFKPNIC